MKFSLFAATLAFAAGALAGAQAPSTALVLTQDQANCIVDQYKSVLENQTYNGQSPYDTTVAVVAEDYHEYSDSILSLISKNNTLGDGAVPVATTREEWYNGVTANPSPGIETRYVYVADGDKILWHWTFPNVGTRQLPATGFNVLHINSDLQIFQADIEFNSIAWGVDIFALNQYCAPPPSASASNATVSSSTTSNSTASSPSPAPSA